MVFRRGLNLRPINSQKNIVDGTFLTVAAATVTTVVLATAVNDFAGSAATLPTGSSIKGIYLFVSIQQQAVNSNVDWYVWKGPVEIAAGMPVPGATGGDQNRRYILHEEKGLPGPVNNGSPPHIFRGVIRIPRGRQRFGEADQIQIRLRGAAAYDACVKCIYKFYS